MNNYCSSHRGTRHTTHQSEKITNDIRNRQAGVGGGLRHVFDYRRDCARVCKVDRP